MKNLRNYTKKKLSGHWRLGPVTIYGANAMHWAINVRVARLHTICFHPTTKTFGRRWPWYLYCSPDCTPSAAWWGFGSGFRKGDNLDRDSEENRKQCRIDRGYE